MCWYLILAELTQSSCLENRSPYVSVFRLQQFTKLQQQQHVFKELHNLHNHPEDRVGFSTALCGFFHIKPFKRRKWALVLCEIDCAFGTYNDDNLKMPFFSITLWRNFFFWNNILFRYSTSNFYLAGQFILLYFFFFLHCFTWPHYKT